ncbi:hypothetical protein BDV93DRAFT_513047 [Ceratobasidium sp. AG-I]|nr:hypothetical protein BDV93DRAFT_513047 [Ceratobasidium sp. AG-I]
MFFFQFLLADIPGSEQSTLESLSSAFRGLGNMTRTSIQQSRPVSQASFSPSSNYLTSPTFSNNLMLSDDDGGPEEEIYGRAPSDTPDHEEILWSGWDEVWHDDHSAPSRLLLLGYRGGIQVWDCSSEQVKEVLNLLSPTIGSVVGATVLPAPVSSQGDSLSEQRPLLGILTSRSDELIIYSLKSHTIVKQTPFNFPHSIRASERFIVISTTAPALHILDAVTFEQLHTISPPSLASPVFSLSRRFLAFASSPPPPSTSPTPTPTTQSPSKVHADISMAIEGARKVGAGVWGGVKSLLGESPSPRSQVPLSPILRSPPPLSPLSRNFAMSPRLYSRSAPTESTYSSSSPAPRVVLPTTGEARPSSSQGHVTVLDLGPLTSGSDPRRVVQHHATPGQAITLLSFARSGNMLAVSGADGVCVRVFEVRPKGRYSLGGPHLGRTGRQVETEPRDTGILWHWYDLQRGVTRRRVTDIVWSSDNKWIAVVTVRGTLHLFAINPYGGQATGASHLLGSGRVVNLSEPQRAPMSLSPILRLHTISNTQPPGSKPSSNVPVSATFSVASKPSYDSGAQDIFVLNRKTGELLLKQCVVRMQSASAVERGMQGMQASISLPGAGISALSSTGLSHLSGSGMSALSSMMRGASASEATSGGGSTSNDRLILGGIEGNARTWGMVKREREWGEVRSTLEKVGSSKQRWKSTRSEWLAQAEISTSTRSLKLLSGPIYLSHQFTFHNLREDWHALLQQAHLNLPASKITVRREVSARAVTGTGLDGAFLGSGAEDMFTTSSSLDAPLASALSGSISPESAAQQIPSFPNAYSGGKGASWKDPVRRLSHFSDGLGQGLGSLGRGIGRVRPSSSEGRVRSPTSPPASSVPGITLEFDDTDALFEADEDLLPREDQLESEAVEGLRTSREDNSSRSAESGSGSAPSTVPDVVAHANPDMREWMGDGSEAGEDAEYSRAREEDSRFDDLVVGFMDEEDEDRRVALEATTPVGKKHRKKR